MSLQQRLLTRGRRGGGRQRRPQAAPPARHSPDIASIAAEFMHGRHASQPSAVSYRVCNLRLLSAALPGISMHNIYTPPYAVVRL